MLNVCTRICPFSLECKSHERKVFVRSGRALGSGKRLQAATARHCPQSAQRRAINWAFTEASTCRLLGTTSARNRAPSSRVPGILSRPVATHPSSMLVWLIAFAFAVIVDFPVLPRWSNPSFVYAVATVASLHPSSLLWFEDFQRSILRFCDGRISSSSP